VVNNVPLESAGSPFMSTGVTTPKNIILVFAAVKTQTIISGPLSPQRGVFPACGWRRRPPVMESSWEYITSSRRQLPKLIP